MKIIKRIRQNIRHKWQRIQQNTRRKWLEFHLGRLERAQVHLDDVMKELRLDYHLQTNVLAAKRTAARTALIRMNGGKR